MPWVFFGAVLLVLLVLLVNWAARTGRTTVRRAMRYLAAFLVAAAAVFLLVRGQAGLALALVALATALASRRRLAMLGGGAKSAKQQSQVDTRYLRVTLDHDSGDLDGLILTGRFGGRYLSDLDRDELGALYDELRRADPEGARLLDAYLARLYPGEWSEEADTAPPSDGPMSRDEAFEILGLEPGATVEEIKQAHHGLMKKFHPDQGGSTYFAARINEAKDLLLKT